MHTDRRTLDDIFQMIQNLWEVNNKYLRFYGTRVDNRGCSEATPSRIRFVSAVCAEKVDTVS